MSLSVALLRQRTWNIAAMAIVVGACTGRGTESASSAPATESAAYPRPGPDAHSQKPLVPGARNASPLDARRLFVDPDSLAAQAVQRAQKDGRTEDAQALSRIAQEPQALRLGRWLPDVYASTNEYVTKAARAGSTALLVTDGFHLDVGLSSGPQQDAASYGQWAREIHAGIGERKAVVVIEPSALADLSSSGKASRYLTKERFDERLKILRDAVLVYRQAPRTRVYIAAGWPGRGSPQELAQLLTKAGVEHADGFALNAGAFRTTFECLDYGREISSLIRDVHFVIDTSRNGAGPYVQALHPEETWCNPPGRKIGIAPTTSTGEALCDAFLWLRRPGESDGECYGGPRQGHWWEQRALEMVR